MNPDPSAPQDSRPPGRPPFNNRRPRRSPRNFRGNNRPDGNRPAENEFSGGSSEGNSSEQPFQREDSGPSQGSQHQPPPQAFDRDAGYAGQAGGENGQGAPAQTGGGPGNFGDRPFREPFWKRVRRERQERRAAMGGGGGPQNGQNGGQNRPNFSNNRPPNRPPRRDFDRSNRRERPERAERSERAERPDFDNEGPTPSQMTPVQLAARIVARSSDQNPADMVLRQTLFRRRGLSPADSEWISRAVFNYFRWERWLNRERPLENRIEDAFSLADRFAADPKAFSDAELVANAVPDWIAAHMNVTPEFARAIQREPALWLRCRPAFTEEVAHNLRDTEPGPLPDSLRYFGTADLFTERGFQSGAYEIQDVASQAVGLVCAPRAPEIWWDACAGEGGKTLHLSSLMGGKSLVWASDRAAWRLDRLKQRAGRAKCFNYRAVNWDGGERPPTKTRFDGILLDAPCSGIGTWGRNPHSRWTTSVNDVTELAEIQKRLLMNVADSLKPGGKLVYAVCTLTEAETSGVADWFTNERSEFETLAVMNPFQPDDPPVTQMHLWPHETGGNGMFIAAWRKG
jgi:16S rRNA (cytosine967-C5)-methyltransferase